MPPRPRHPLAARARRSLPLLAFGLALGGALSAWRGAAAPEGAPPWVSLDGGGGLASALLPRRVASLEEGPGGLDDLYLAWARLGPDGRPLSTWWAVDVTRSPAVSETRLAVAPGRVAVLTDARPGSPASVEVYLLDQPPVARRGWSWTEAAAGAAESLQLWGQPVPPRRLGLHLPPTARRPEIDLDADGLVARWEGGSAEVDLRALALVRASPGVSLVERAEGRPDPFRLAVDQLRHGRLVGPERLQQIEALYLALSDGWAALAGERLARAAASELPRDLDAEVGEPEPGAGWPPPPLAPLLDPPVAGEGLWRGRARAFSPSSPAGAPLLVSTFVRTEPERPRTSVVSVTAWDPAWIELHWEAGTIEPRSVEGIAGAGRAPRESVERLVAGFNGGFQAVDGAFGMRTRAGPFLPPQPYAATVAELPGGRIGLGTWPAEPRAGEGLVAYRQNLSPVVDEGRINPFGRAFWGGVPRGSHDSSRTDRTGLCLTREGHLAYLWGRRVTVDGLARGMLAARCVYGMMLDINFTNTAFELYRVAPRGLLPPLHRPLDPELEAEGEVEGRPDLVFRVQAMAPGMTRVGFPRFVRTDLRDFFYLLARQDAFGPALSLGGEARPVACGAGAPPCAYLHEVGEAEVVEPCLDRLAASLSAAPRGIGEGTLAFPVTPASDAARTGARVVLSRSPYGGLSLEIGGPSAGLGRGEVALSGLQPSAASPDPAAEGTLVARWPDGRAAFAATTAGGARGLASRLEAAGATATLFVPAGAATLLLDRDPAPMATRIFAETEPVPPRVWRPLARRAQESIDALGLTRHYVQARDYRESRRARR